MLPTLDAHAHLDPDRWKDAPPDMGGVLAMSRSVAEGVARHGRGDPFVAWGIGCHPRHLRAQSVFEVDAFDRAAEGSAVIGEVGLDGTAQTPPDLQLATFRAVLAVARQRPRIVSIHAHAAEERVLDELDRTPVSGAILHRFEGTAAEIRRAVRLGCSFSIHAAVARRSAFRSSVPLDRVLVESDHAYADPPAAIPLRIGWVEHLVGQQYGIAPEEVRAAAWGNLARIVEEAGVARLLPIGLRRALAGLPTPATR